MQNAMIETVGVGSFDEPKNAPCQPRGRDMASVDLELELVQQPATQRHCAVQAALSVELQDIPAARLGFHN